MAVLDNSQRSELILILEQGARLDTVEARKAFLYEADLSFYINILPIETNKHDFCVSLVQKLEQDSDNKINTKQPLGKLLEFLRQKYVNGQSTALKTIELIIKQNHINKKFQNTKPSHTNNLDTIPSPYKESNFVERPIEYDKIVKLLQSRENLILIRGIGGAGKSSLVYKIAKQVIENNILLIKFKKVIWINVEESTNLMNILDKILLEFGVTGNDDPDWKKKQVQNEFRKRLTLIIFDNMHNAHDESLITWISDQRNSKIIIISVTSIKGMEYYAKELIMEGMKSEEATRLIENTLKFKDIPTWLVNGKEDLIEKTGGNPFAIQRVLGYITKVKEPLTKVLISLPNNVYKQVEYLFSRFWESFDPITKSVWMVLSFFPSGATKLCVETILEISQEDCRSALLSLEEPMLFNAEYYVKNNRTGEMEARYILHPLVKTFFTEIEIKSNTYLENKLREGWIKYYQELILKYSEDKDELEQYEIVNQEIENIHAAMDYCLFQKEFGILTNMVLSMRSFWGSNGYYEKRDTFREACIKYAETIYDQLESSNTDKEVGTQNLVNLIKLYCMKARGLGYQSELNEALDLCKKTRYFLEKISDFRLKSILLLHINDTQLRVHEARGHREESEFHQMLYYAKKNVRLAKQLKDENKRIINSYRVAEGLYFIKKKREAERLFCVLLRGNKDRENRHLRSPIRANFLMAEIEIERSNFSKAWNHYREAFNDAKDMQDRRFLAKAHRIAGKIYLKQNDFSKAIIEFEKSKELLKKLNLQAELLEVIRTLEHIKTP